MKYSLFFALFIISVFSLDSRGQMDYARRRAAVYRTLETHCDINAKEQFPEFVDACNYLINDSELCKNIDEDKLVRCENVTIIDAFWKDWEGLKSCLVGAGKSAWDFILMLKDIALWVARADEQAPKAIADGWGFVSGEYARTYEETHGNFVFGGVGKALKAAKNMVVNLATKVGDVVSALVKEKYREYECLNSEARNEMYCNILGDILFPPAGAIALLKLGPAALKSSRLVRAALDKAKLAVQSGRAGLSALKNAPFFKALNNYSLLAREKTIEFYRSARKRFKRDNPSLTENQLDDLAREKTRQKALSCGPK